MNNSNVAAILNSDFAAGISISEPVGYQDLPAEYIDNLRAAFSTNPPITVIAPTEATIEFIEPPKRKRCYIAGKVSGLPYMEVREKFAYRAMMLAARGFEVINPMNLVPPDTEWEPAMKLALIGMLQCDSIYMLHDWQKSDGAMLQQALADVLNMEIIYELNDFNS